MYNPFAHSAALAWQEEINKQNRQHALFESVHRILDPHAAHVWNKKADAFMRHLDPTLRIFLMKKEN